MICKFESDVVVHAQSVDGGVDHIVVAFFGRAPQAVAANRTPAVPVFLTVEDEDHFGMNIVAA